MKKIISKYITKAEALLLIQPNNISIKSYLLRLKLLKNVPDVHLSNFDEVVPLIYDALSEENNESQSRSMVMAFKVMVDNAKIANAEAKRTSSI